MDVWKSEEQGLNWLPDICPFISRMTFKLHSHSTLYSGGDRHLNSGYYNADEKYKNTT